jgi:hypothetical protein
MKMTFLTKFYLELKTRSMKLIEDQEFEEAERVLSVIIDDEKANNPLYRYLRAKCYFNIGASELSKARLDLSKVIRYTQKVPKKGGQILLVKAHYMNGLLEMSFGADQKRTIYHFEQFLIILKLYSIHKLKIDIPEIKEMESNATDYVQ